MAHQNVCPQVAVSTKATEKSGKLTRLLYCSSVQRHQAPSKGQMANLLFLCAHIARFRFHFFV